MDKITVWNDLRQRDLKVFATKLQPALISQAAQQAGTPLGNGPLHLGTLLWLGLASALHIAKNFADVLGLVLKLLRDACDDPTPFGIPSKDFALAATCRRRHKHDPRGPDPTHLTEEAFTQARRRMPWSFWVNLLLLLVKSFEHSHPQRLRWKRFRLLALDGTTLNLPHWTQLTRHFGTVRNGRGRPRPQARMVLLQFPQARLPWRYELTPLAEGERTVAGRLLQGLAADDLVLMDRGFWSYGLFWQIQRQQAFFAIRLTAQVKLQTLRQLGRDDRLTRWQPADWRKQWKKAGLLPTIDLRVIDYQMKGFRPSAVVTNILDPEAVSREEWVRLAAIDEVGRVVEPGLYHRRWQIETTFYELKVTQGLEGSLRSRTPEGIGYEVAGHMLLYLLVRWLIVEAAEQAGVEDPLRVSFKGALQELADMRQTLLLASVERVDLVLLPRLLERMASHQVLFRPGRHYARPRDTQSKYKGKGRYQKAGKLAPMGT